MKARTSLRLGRCWPLELHTSPAGKLLDTFLYLWVRVPKRIREAFLPPSAEVLGIAPDYIHLVKQSPETRVNEVGTVKNTPAES